jgi:hypothetical protein
MAHWWMQEEVWKDVDLSTAQESRVQELVARRFMETAHTRGEAAQPWVEYLLEKAVETNGWRRDPENPRELGQRLAPIVQLNLEILGGMPEAVEGVLSPEQRGRLEAGFTVQKQALERIEERLKLMANGQDVSGWNVYQDLDEVFGKTSEAAQKGNPAMRRLQRDVERSARQAEKGEWKLLLKEAEVTFKFDEAQKARGEALLAEYVKRAEAIQSPEWKAQLRYNLTWRFAASNLENVPTGPWVSRLEQSVRVLMKPIDKLGWSFLNEILALATPQQRADAALALRKLAEDHGMPAGERPGEPMNLLAPDRQARHN